MTQFTYIAVLFLMEFIVLRNYDPSIVSSTLGGSYAPVDEERLGDRSKSLFGQQSRAAIKYAVEPRPFGASGMVDASYASQHPLEHDSRLRLFDSVGSARRTVSLHGKPLLFKSRNA
jgi:hypothetical protein